MYAAGQAIAIRQARKHVKKQTSAEQTHPAVRPTPGSGERFPRFPQQVHSKHHGNQGDQQHRLRPHQHPACGGRGPHINGKISWQGVAPEGKAAWQDQRGGVGGGQVLGGQRQSLHPRPSVTEAAASHRCKATEAHRRWMKRNRVRDASSGEYSYYGGFRAGGAATALLYVGLGTVAVGLVISFVGLGEKGFKTLELRMIGPSLIVGGLLLCLLRIFLCTCCPPPFAPPTSCLRRNPCLGRWPERRPRPSGKSQRESEDEEAAASSRYGFEEASLLRGGKRKKVSPEALTTASSSHGFAGEEGKRKVSRHLPPGAPQLPPAALHVQRRPLVQPQATQPRSSRTPPTATHLPNQVVGEEERGVGLEEDIGKETKGGGARGRTNKVWSEVAGVPPEGRWVAPEGDERKRRARSAGGREAGGEGCSAAARASGRGLADPDPDARRVEGSEWRHRARGPAGPSRRTPERRPAHRHSASRAEKELVLSPAALEGL